MEMVEGVEAVVLARVVGVMETVEEVVGLEVVDVVEEAVVRVVVVVGVLEKVEVSVERPGLEEKEDSALGVEEMAVVKVEVVEVETGVVVLVGIEGVRAVGMTVVVAVEANVDQVAGKVEVVGVAAEPEDMPGDWWDPEIHRQATAL
eukprot:gene13929-16466_t